MSFLLDRGTILPTEQIYKKHVITSKGTRDPRKKLFVSTNKELLMKHPLKLMTLTLAALIMLAYAAHANGQSNDVPSVVTVSVPGAGIVDIQINNYENPSKNAGNKTLLAVHGIAHSGATFEPLANELFKKTGRDKIDRVLALNFPGRNGSGLPSNLQFGNLTVEDFTAILLGVLDQLAKHVNIEGIVGHSMGGLIVQIAQNSLMSAGTSLRKEYGIQNVYLLAPAIPNPLPWLFADSGEDRL
jgi:pimeloyl-ACP methyl ester carboxylesterase